MSIRYSKCHFAEVMTSIAMTKDYRRIEKTTYQCSFCGEICELVPQEHTLGHDLELTLRRWKDGDCGIGDVFERINAELIRSYEEARSTAAATLQGDKKPMYELLPGHQDWTPTTTERDV